MSQSNDDKIANERLQKIDFISKSVNIRAACLQVGMSRSQFYEYLRRYDMYGFDGLKNRSSAHYSHPATTLPELEQQILDLSWEHPAWGCDKLYDYLKKEGVTKSAETIRTILNKNGIGTYYDRWLKLERNYLQNNYELTEEQIAFIEKINPAFRQRKLTVNYPGQLLSQAVFSVGYPKRINKYYFHVVVDAYSCYAFGLLRTSKKTSDAISLLEKYVLPYFQDRSFNVNVCLTNYDRVYCDSSYDEFIDRKKIAHLYPKGRPWTTGYMERFKQTVLKFFFSSVLDKTLNTSFETLQASLSGWLLKYNNENIIHGYPNYGRTPSERVDQELSSMK